MKLFPELIWHFTRKNEPDDKIFLTFDDGPTPEVTPWVLRQLRKHNAKATFFCLGRNVDRYPDLYQSILDEGHSVGNHTYSHLKGSQTNNSEYYNDIELAGETIQSRLYRPPYGRFRKSQIREIQKKYQIVMWDVLSQDYDSRVTPRQCLSNVLENIRSGSIVVFHDSFKAKRNLYYALESLLEKCSSKYQFSPIRVNV